MEGSAEEERVGRATITSHCNAMIFIQMGRLCKIRLRCMLTRGVNGGNRNVGVFGTLNDTCLCYNGRNANNWMYDCTVFYKDTVTEY